jgi:TolB-like protein/Flp pilus assembly protein TadD
VYCYLPITPGVNRPLRSEEDNPGNNLNKTFYRNQINKVAIAIKDIISGLRKESIEFEVETKDTILTIEKPIVQEKSIIVLPFENISPDPDQEYFSDGLTEEIITDLSHIHDLLVISRSSAMTFKGTRKTIPEIAQTVNVRYILEGSVRKTGNNLRVTAQLIDSLTDTHLWAEKYFGTLDDIFDIQEKVARAIVNGIHLKLTPKENACLACRYKVIPEAYEAYLKGRQEYNKFTGEGFTKGIEYLQHSITLDPDFPLSYTSLSSCYAWFGNWCLGPAREVFPKAREAAMKAIQLDANLAEAHASMGVVMWEYDWNWQSAETEFRIAISLNPNSSQSHNLYSNYLLTMGRFDEAIKEASIAMELDPTSIAVSSVSAYAYFWAGCYKEAITRFENILVQDPKNGFIYSCLAHALIGIGNIQEAMVAVEKARWSIASGTEMHLDSWLAGAYISIGKPEEAEKLAEIWENLSSQRYVDPGMMPCFYVWLGKKDKTKLDKAFEWMRRGLEERSPQMVWYKTSPLRPLPEHRMDSRWLYVLQKIGFKN